MWPVCSLASRELIVAGGSALHSDGQPGGPVPQTEQGLLVGL